MREQELLALVDSLKHWRHYLLDAPFQIKTDHKSLEYLQTQPPLSGRLVRWSQYLQEYDFSLEQGTMRSRRSVQGWEIHAPRILSASADAFVAIGCSPTFSWGWKLW